jgi:hypothetical protein
MLLCTMDICMNRLCVEKGVKVHMDLQECVENIIVIYLVGSEFVPANFILSYFSRQFIIVLFLSSTY